MCSHCVMAGHTKERCYKLHGYPLSYKSTRFIINSVNGNPSDNIPLESQICDGPSLPFTQEQCQQLLPCLNYTNLQINLLWFIK